MSFESNQVDAGDERFPCFEQK